MKQDRLPPQEAARALTTEPPQPANPWIPDDKVALLETPFAGLDCKLQKLVATLGVGQIVCFCNGKRMTWALSRGVALVLTRGDVTCLVNVPHGAANQAICTVSFSKRQAEPVAKQSYAGLTYRSRGSVCVCCPLNRSHVLPTQLQTHIRETC